MKKYRVGGIDEVRKIITGTGVLRHVLLIASVAALYFVSQENYLLFHTVTEIFSIVIAFGIFMFAWNTRRMLDNQFFMVMGIAFLFVGGLDFLHTLAYKGMGVFPDADANTATQLWISARYVQSFSMLAAILAVNRKTNTGLLFLVYIVVAGFLLTTIFYWQNFPVCYLEESGLTGFKITSEMIISFVLLTTGVFIWLRRDRFSSKTAVLLIVSVAVTILSELSFTLYKDVYGISNMLGHIFKLLSFYLIYVAIIETGLRDPISVLSRNLRLADDGLQQEIELRGESERIFRNLVETSPLYIQVYDENSLLVYVNKAGLDLRGYRDIEEYLRIPEKDRLTPESFERVRQWHEDEQDGKPLPSPFYIDIIRKNGDILNLMGFRNEIIWDGKPCFQITFVDMTEQKTLEEREKQLEAEIVKANRLAAIGQMAAGIAHEINNPLTWMLGYSGLLMERELPEDIRNDISLINDGARRVSSITRRMLTFAREREPELAETDINDVIQMTLHLRSYDMSVNNIRLDLDLASDLSLVMIDIGQMQQVFLNIILNAEIEMQNAHGGGLLKISTEELDGFVRVVFKDDGPGIPEENLERIFEPFFTTRRVGEGTGLGLSVSYGIIAGHEGRLYARSKPGEGATFIVELPASVGGKKSGAAATPFEPLSTQSASILVVDDERNIRTYVRELLRKQGYTVKLAESGEEALRMVDETAYDVVLLDVKLPGFSGIEVYEQLLDRSDTWDRKIIFVTGDVMGTDTMSYILSTEIPFVAKPFDPTLLLKTIERILKNR